MNANNVNRSLDLKVLAVNFHYVRPIDTRYPKLHRRSLEEFKSQLDTLESLAPSISPNQLEDMLLDPINVRLDRGFVLTFDDGLKDHYLHVASELDNRNLKAFFFVNSAPWEGELLGVHRLQLLNASVPFQQLFGAFSDWLENEEIALDIGTLNMQRVRKVYSYDQDDVARFKFAINFVLEGEQKDRAIRQLFLKFLGEESEHVSDLYLSSAECRELANMGHTIGCHSHRHRPLSTLTPADCSEDLALNSKSIEETVGRKPSWISFPNGVIDSDDVTTLNTCRESGLHFGFTMNRGFIESDASQISLNRVDTNDAPGGKSPSIGW